MTRSSRFGLDAKSIDWSKVAFVVFIIGFIVGIVILFMSWMPKSKSKFGADDDVIDYSLGQGYAGIYDEGVPGYNDSHLLYASGAGELFNETTGLSPVELPAHPRILDNFVRAVPKWVKTIYPQFDKKYNLISVWGDGGFRIYNIPEPSEQLLENLNNSTFAHLGTNSYMILF
jgi:hypothetical protein